MKPKQGCLYASGAFALLILLFVGFITLGGIRSKSELDKSLAEARSLGMPATAAEFVKSVKASENAAPLLSEAFKEVDAMYKADRELSKLMGSQTPVAELPIDRFDSVLAKVSRAVKLPHCVFTRDWSDGLNVVFPELAQSKSIARLLNIRARVKAQRGDIQGAYDDIGVIVRLANLVGEEDFLIARLVQIAERAIATRTIEQVLTDGGPSSTSIQAARRVLRQYGPINVKSSLRGEFLFQRLFMEAATNAGKMEEAFKLVSGGGTDPSTSNNSISATLMATAFKTPALRNRMDKTYVDLHIQFYKEVPNDPNDILGMVKAMRAMDSRARSHSGKWEYVLADILEPVYVGVGDAAGRDMAKRRALESLLDYLSVRPAPATFAPKQLDPFTNKPLKFRKSADQSIAYSVGPDGNDDGAPMDVNKANLDVSVVYPYKGKRPKFVGSDYD